MVLFNPKSLRHPTMWLVLKSPTSHSSLRSAARTRRRRRARTARLTLPAVSIRAPSTSSAAPAWLAASVPGAGPRVLSRRPSRSLSVVLASLPVVLAGRARRPLEVTVFLTRCRLSNHVRPFLHICETLYHGPLHQIVTSWHRSPEATMPTSCSAFFPTTSGPPRQQTQLGFSLPPMQVWTATRRPAHPRSPNTSTTKTRQRQHVRP